MKQTGWGIDLLLKSLYSHLHETPARRKDYTKMTGSEVFPLQFCGHRWLEDKRVAERAVEMWPSLTTYITEILKKPKSQVPTSSSFSTVKSVVLNKLTTAKLEFLAHLVFYQTSLCNHDLSIMHSCRPASVLCTALLATGFRIETSYLV